MKSKSHKIISSIGKKIFKKYFFEQNVFGLHIYIYFHGRVMKLIDTITNQYILNNRTTDKLQANDFYAAHFINSNIIVRTIHQTPNEV